MQFMNVFDRAMNLLDEKFMFLSSGKQIVSDVDEDKKVKKMVSTFQSYTGLY